jgi:hypothetical protein
MPVRPVLRRVTLLALCVLTTGGLSPTAPADAQPRVARRSAQAPAPGVETITQAQLRDYLTFVAADDLEGRDTPSRGLDITARFLATIAARAGLSPAGEDGTFFQEIALTRRLLDAEGTSLTIGTRTLTLGDEYLPSTGRPGSVSGPVVYVGHGYVIGSRDIDPYKDVDVRGAIVVAHPGLPEGIQRTDLQGPQGEDWNDAPGAAADRGAVAVLYLADYAALDNWTRRRTALDSRGTLLVDAFADGPAAPRLPTATIAPGAYAALFQGEREGPAEIFRRVAERRPAGSFALAPARRVSLTIATTEERAVSRNVVAVLHGSDPVLKDEYVALGAHYDHVGLADGGEEGDGIHNGADDNGSGTVALLAMAEALAAAPRRPKRSMLFVWHTGEEKGLWGSRYFTARPTVPIDRIVTQINVDMIGRSREPGDTTPANQALTGPDTVYVIGSRLMSSELGALTERVNDGFLNLTYDYRYADPHDPDRFFYRSDHYHYATRGIPVVFYFTGVHEDYHAVGDDVEKIDFRKMQRIAQTIYATAWAVAELPVRPHVDTPLGRELQTR